MRFKRFVLGFIVIILTIVMAGCGTHYEPYILGDENYGISNEIADKGYEVTDPLMQQKGV